MNNFDLSVSLSLNCSLAVSSSLCRSASFSPLSPSSVSARHIFLNAPFRTAVRHWGYEFYTSRTNYLFALKTILPVGNFSCFQTTEGHRPCERHAHMECSPNLLQGSFFPSMSSIGASFCFSNAFATLGRFWNLFKNLAGVFVHKTSNWCEICTTLGSDSIIYELNYMSSSFGSRQDTNAWSFSAFAQTRMCLLIWIVSPCFNGTSPCTGSPFTLLFTLYNTHFEFKNY